MQKNLGKSKKRVEELFSDIPQLVQEPPPNGGKDHAHGPLPAPYKSAPLPHVEPNHSQFTGEMETLRSRILELETHLQETERSASESTRSGTLPTASSRIIYEKEELGFTYQDDKISPLPHTPQATVSEDSVIKSPLMAGGQTIGKVQVTQSDQRPMTAEDVNLTNAVAQQASTQIQNLRLLAAAEQARAEAQEATRQFTHKNWESFLDGIHNNERIGYVYDQAAVEPSLDRAPADHDHMETVQVLDEQVGRLFVKADPSHPITDEDKALISAFAKQIGQQVENIRLLADAARARAEAEQATRLLTRQNWENYTEEQEGVIGFVYDSINVSPLGIESVTQDIALEQPFVVRGETIGHLSVAGVQNVSQESRDLAAAIASQASVHLETLRLNEELQKRARELQELDRLKSAFLANMSHELRTPLNSILGFADVMLEELDGPLTDNMNNDLSLIHKNGQHLLHLINDVLDMAKIDSGKMNLNIESFNLQDTIQEVVSITSPLASEKNLSLFIEPDSDHEVEINADKIRVRQVMINLVNNAMKFTEKGGISIRVTREENSVLISVKDTGIGIPVDLLESVFQEFTQVDTSTTRKVGGTGLGLPISRRLIEMHSGRLWAESSGIDGEGSTFYVFLPIESKIKA
jgi:signal transduction histidine kinase